MSYKLPGPVSFVDLLPIVPSRLFILDDSIIVPGKN